MLLLLTLSHLLQLAAASGAQSAASHPSNPVKVSRRQWLGNVTSENTPDGRDLGFQGHIGHCWINTFGDTFSCTDSNPQRGCNTENIFARNSAGLSNQDDPTKYTDISVNPATDSVDATFVPHIGYETADYPLGITNVISTGKFDGVIYYLAGNGSSYNCASGTCYFFQGAGVASIKADYSCGLTVDRPQLSMWEFNEVYYGDHGVVRAKDGMLYAFGGLPYTANSAVSVARVKPSDATDINAYEYWNGKHFQKDRIYNPTSELSVFSAGQGTVYYNKYYKRYLYISSNVFNIYCLSAEHPWGPWSGASQTLFSKSDMPYHFDGTGFQGFYTPAIQHKFSDPEGRYLVLWFTYLVSGTKSNPDSEHQIITAVNITFT